MRTDGGMFGITFDYDPTQGCFHAIQQTTHVMVRRLSTASSVVEEKAPAGGVGSSCNYNNNNKNNNNSNKYLTNWKWYWMKGQGVWEEYSSGVSVD